jgi:phosphoribosylformylglycinamidine synthase
MKNDYGKGPDKISIPPTLLFSLFGDHPDVRNSATSDLKHPGDKLYLVGESLEELGASELAFMMAENGQAAGIGGNVPSLTDPERLFSSYRALSKAINSGVVKTAHDCSEGGVGVALAEMCIGGRIGAKIDIDGTGNSSTWARLYGESLGRIIIAVSPQNNTKFLELMAGHTTTLLGEVEATSQLSIVDGFDELVSIEVNELVTSWQGTLDLTGGVA